MLKCMREIKGITACFVDTLIEHSSSKNNFYSIASIMGSIKSIIIEDFGKFQEII